MNAVSPRPAFRETTPELRAKAAALHGAGQVEAALLVLQEVVRREPGDFGGQYNLGFVLQHLGRLDPAIAAYRAALAAKPAFGEARVNLGSCLLLQGRVEEAEREYAAAVEVAPALHPAQLNLGIARRRLGRHEESLAPLRAALALAPADVQAWDHLYASLMALKRPMEAVDAFLAWEPKAPPSAELTLAGLTLSRLAGDRAREAKYLDLCVRWPFPPPHSDFARLPLSIAQYFDLPPGHLLALYERYANLMGSGVFENYSGQMKRTRGGRIRVGYLSPDFRDHVMGRLMRHVFENHDAKHFEVYAFSLAAERFEDAATAWFREHAVRFSNVSALADAQAARLIADHDLDILVDLAGHTQGSRPEILAYKPARVVITHLGYHGCVGIRQVDYKLADRLVDEPANARFQVEKLLFMDACIFPFDHVAPSQNPGPTREEAGLAGRVVFGEFVNPLKLAPRLVDAWARILAQVPEGVLAFSPFSDGDKPVIAAILAKAGIGADRVAFLPPGRDDAERRARYRLVDLVLDTFPYAGGDTTVAALDSGVPVVSLTGRRHSERTGESILTHAGLPQFVTRSEDDYVALAVELAKDGARRAKAADDIRAAWSVKQAEGHAGYVRALETAYAHALAEKGVRLDTPAAMSVDEFQTAFRAALVAHQSGRKDDAILAYERLAVEQPDYPPLNYFFAMLLRERDLVQRARTLLQRAVHVSPSYADAQVALGNLELEAGRPAQARKAFEAVTAVRADRADAWSGLGLALEPLGEPDGSIAAFQRALALDTGKAAAHLNLAIALQKARRVDESRTAYRAALAIDPNSAETLLNFGLLLDSVGQRELAITSWRGALSIEPALEAAYVSLHEALRAGGRLAEWVANFESFAKWCPDSPRLALYAIAVAQHQGDLLEATRCFHQAVAAAQREKDDAVAADFIGPLLEAATFFKIDDSERLALETRHSQALRALHPQLPLAPPREAGGKVRVGYLTAAFADEASERLALAFLARHDRSRFEVSVYSLSAYAGRFTETVRTLADRVAGIEGLPLRAAGEFIARARLDVLVDLCEPGHGGAAAILALKPARIQVAHPAFAGSARVATVDYRLTDAVLEPAAVPLPAPGAKPLAMDGCVFPYSPRTLARKAPMGRFQLGLPADAFVFGVFGEPRRFSPATLEAWRLLLARVPNAILAFSPPFAADAVAAQRLAVAAGIEPHRTAILPGVEGEGGDAWRWLFVDCALDTFPRSSPLEAMDALSQGVPVVTLEGARIEERGAFRVLSAAGLPELVAATPTAYGELAARLAADAPWRASLREAIGRRVPASTLADTTAHTRALESALLAGLAQSGIRIEP
ncbi:MAG: tetratricopeptide repeat protein [Betaproteobacteria bacterium]|nr:tetratricopeptide repeat protein [Betaproteobacteria bacterium]